MIKLTRIGRGNKEYQNKRIKTSDEILRVLIC